MSRYFTSDWHLGSNLINKYANRPFASASEAAEALVGNCNSIAKSKSDVVFHVGDFWLDNADRHGVEEDINTFTASYDDYISLVDARLVLLAGNHDDGHNCEADLKSMVIDLNQNYKNVFVSHFPSYHKNYRGPFGNLQKAPRIALCGHVHDKWLLNYDKQHHVLNINVGVDVWNYKPVRDSEITKLLDYVFEEHDFVESWHKTLAEFGIWKKNNDKLHAEIRAKRKQEKLKKKGLTLEDCERRRIEAMKAKGLIV